MKKAKGYLVPIGGDEDKGIAESFATDGILRHLLNLFPQSEPVIELITTASSIPLEIAAIYRKAFDCLGCPTINHLHIGTRCSGYP